ncbi:interferon-induced protein 44-like [Limanda limanda]|uniref:interferon-induced protein 44-like n=1 Tax=Limanda limanda TaxID=27771 RepID=UPI0029C96077|nr:interferon-induced protein 44-like [Limanda limanda]
MVGQRRMMEKPSSLMNNTSHPLQDTITALGSSFSTRRIHPKCLKESTGLSNFTKAQRPSNFVFNDIMGFEKDSDSGVPVKDVKLALRGHVKECYKFNPDQEDGGLERPDWQPVNWTSLRSHSVQSHISKAMGSSQSKAPPVSPPSPLLEQPWRKVSEEYQSNLVFVNSYQPVNKQVKHLRILLHGPVGAGKSSFINSVDSVLKGRPAGRALTDSTSGTSYTKQYRTFELHKISGASYSFVFNDIMGFEQDDNGGVLVEDVKMALRGHVKEGYKFNPKKVLMEGDDGYKSYPTLEDKVHVMVCVVPADALSRLSDETVKKIREVRLAASELGIPQLAIITKVDEACPEVKKDTSNIYKSKYLKEQVERFHQLLGLPLNCIFLVQNNNQESNDNINPAILCALKRMLWYGEDFLKDQEHEFP